MAESRSGTRSSLPPRSVRQAAPDIPGPPGRAAVPLPAPSAPPPATGQTPWRSPTRLSQARVTPTPPPSEAVSKSTAHLPGTPRALTATGPAGSEGLCVLSSRSAANETVRNSERNLLSKGSYAMCRDLHRRKQPPLHVCHPKGALAGKVASNEQGSFADLQGTVAVACEHSAIGHIHACVHAYRTHMYKHVCTYKHT